MIHLFRPSHFFIGSLLSILHFGASGQNVNDLVRYSQTQMQGSARFEAMGGAFGALGSDLSCALINPAGYGRYSSSQANMGFNFSNIQNASTFEGITAIESRNPFKLGSLGVVFVGDISEGNKGFLYNQFGISYNRVENFSNDTRYEGRLFNSLLDGFASQAAGYIPDDLATSFPFSTSLAWQTYAIDEDGNGGYVPRLTSGDMYHKRNIETRGGISEYSFSYSANYLNKLYLGVNWGIRVGKYNETYTHHEVLLDNAGVTLDSFDYQYQLETRGNGNNFKIGVIYLPVEALRLGLALHTATYYQFKDDWSADMIAYHKDGIRTVPEEYKPTADYKYRLRTPARVVGSVGYVFGTRGCIDIDVEYVNYKWANFKSTKDASYAPYDYNFENNQADTTLRSVVNIRAGGELVFQSQYFVRAGIAYYPQAYATSQPNQLPANKLYSVGFGFKWNDSSIDLAYKRQEIKSNYYAFPESRTQVRSTINSFILSYSITF
jgi:hypothetical protein